MALKYFNKRTYTDVGEALSAIRKELEDIRGNTANTYIEEGAGSNPQSYIPEIQDTDAEYEYNGPYKMILDGDKVRIVDGATYNEKTKTSDDMLVVVNNTTMYAKPFVSESKTADAVFAMCFTSNINEDGTLSETPPSVEVVDLSIDHNNYIPSNTYHNVWRRIGRLLVTDGVYKISQDHQSGDMNMDWYVSCLE